MIKKYINAFNGLHVFLSYYSGILIEQTNCVLNSKKNTWFLRLFQRNCMIHDILSVIKILQRH